MKERIILGIDPGTNIMGYGVIKCLGNKHSLVDLGIITMKNVKDPMERLQHIYHGTIELMKKFQATETALEDPFYGKNVQSMLKLGRAQGMAIAASIQQNIPVFQYAPRKIKQSITGKGSASKEQVAAMLKHIFALQELPHGLDATDGLAVAVCHFYQRGATDNGSKNYNSWKNFLGQNPDRLAG